jgi:hypothetical protein
VIRDLLQENTLMWNLNSTSNINSLSVVYVGNEQTYPKNKAVKFVSFDKGRPPSFSFVGNNSFLSKKTHKCLYYQKANHLIRDNKAQIAIEASAKQQFNVTTFSKKLYVATLLIKEGTNDT